MNEGILASKTLGKWPVASNQLQGESLPDHWALIALTVQEQLEMTLKTKNSKIAQMDQEMRRMQQTIDELQSKTQTQRILVVTNIANPQTPDVQRITNVGNVIVDFNTIKSIQKGDKTTTAAAGVIRRPLQSPCTDTSSEGGRSDNGHGVDQLANVG